MRTFNKTHINQYLQSGFAIEAYKNKAIEELEIQQFEDQDLQNEIAFTTMLKRLLDLRSRTNKQIKPLLKKEQIKKIQQPQQQLKKIQLQPVAPITEEVQPVLQEQKNYKNLFADKINTKNWTKAELLIRDQYILEYKQIMAKEGGCSQCKKNALVQKYMKKIQTMKDNNLI